MSKENGAPSAAEKGKGKMDDDKAADAGKKVDETKKDNDGKPVVNGKKGEKPQDGTWHTCGFLNQSTDYVLSSVEELSEEDQQLKTELEMLVSRLKVESPASETPQLSSYIPPTRNQMPVSTYLRWMQSKILSKHRHHQWLPSQNL